MLMPLETLAERYGLNLKGEGVLHLGAHLAEEAEVYDKLQVGPVWWVEANHRVMDKIRRNLKKYPDQMLIEALVWSKAGLKRDFNVTNYDGMSSSMLKFGTHTKFSPDTQFVATDKLITTTVDHLVQRYTISAKLLSMDLQGVEGPVLRGAKQFLRGVNYVITEVNKTQVYVGCTQVTEIDGILEGYGMKRVQTEWVPNQGWGDALYVREKVV